MRSFTHSEAAAVATSTTNIHHCRLLIASHAPDQLVSHRHSFESHLPSNSSVHRAKCKFKISLSANKSWTFQPPKSSPDTKEGRDRALITAKRIYVTGLYPLQLWVELLHATASLSPRASNNRKSPALPPHPLLILRARKRSVAAKVQCDLAVSLNERSAENGHRAREIGPVIEERKHPQWNQ